MNTQLQQTDPRLGVPVLPGRWPLLGHLPSMRRDLPGVMDQAHHAHASHMAWVDLGGGALALLWSDRRVFELLRNKVTTSEHLRETASAIVGHSVVTTDGKPHRRMRGSMNKAFTPKALTASGTCRVINEVVSERVPKLFGGGGFVALDETQRLALDIIFRIMGVPDEELEGFRVNYNRLLMGGFGPDIDFPLTPRWWGRRARRWLDQRFIALIHAAREDTSTEGLLAELVRGRDENGDGQSDDELIDNLVLLALAGHETTASIMAWMLGYASQDPELLDELMAEATAAEGLPESPSALGAFPLVTGLFRECLRLHPPASFLTREVTGELRVDDVLVPVGTTVAVPLHFLSRDPEVYADPQRFNPRRWLERGLQPTPIEKAGFGHGPHFCLGYHVAVVEGVSFMVGALREMARTGKRLRFPKGLPRQEYFPLLRPKKGDTRCEVVSA